MNLKQLKQEVVIEYALCLDPNKNEEEKYQHYTKCMTYLQRINDEYILPLAKCFEQCVIELADLINKDMSVLTRNNKKRLKTLSRRYQDDKSKFLSKIRDDLALRAIAQYTYNRYSKSFDQMSYNRANATLRMIVYFCMDEFHRSVNAKWLYDEIRNDIIMNRLLEEEVTKLNDFFSGTKDGEELTKVFIEPFDPRRIVCYGK